MPVINLHLVLEELEEEKVPLNLLHPCVDVNTNKGGRARHENLRAPMSADRTVVVGNA
jgi:hypothetical protein